MYKDETIIKSRSISYRTIETSKHEKVEISITSLAKATKRVHVKATSKRKAHYRTIEVGRKEEEVEEDTVRYSGKLYHSTSKEKIGKILSEGFKIKKSDVPYSEYGFVYFSPNAKTAKMYGESTLEVDVKDIKIADKLEFNKTLDKYRDKWDEKIESMIDEVGFNHPKVKELYHEREGKNDVMINEVIKDFNSRFDAIRGLSDDIIITNLDKIKDIRQLNKEEKSSLHPDNLSEIKSLSESGIPGLVGGIHAEETFVCKFKDGSSALHKVMDPCDIIGEIGAYEVSKIIGWNIIPETIQCNYGKGEGSSQKWIPDAKEPYSGYCEECEIKLEEKHLDDLSKIFIMDMMSGNDDRHCGNIIIDKNDKCWAIDNESMGGVRNFNLNIKFLNEWAEKGDGTYVTFARALENSFGNDSGKYKKFKEYVDSNLVQVLQHKDEIIKYWRQYRYGSEDRRTQHNAKEVMYNINEIENYCEGLKDD